MANWDQIKDAVEKNGNVKTVTMKDLRDAHGTLKLGSTVREQISAELAGMGLGHIPQVLPNNQDELVRVYKHGTPIGELIDTVLKPGPLNDNKLSAQFGGEDVDNAAIVQKIRELVTE